MMDSRTKELLEIKEEINRVDLEKAKMKGKIDSFMTTLKKYARNVKDATVKITDMKKPA